MSDTVKDERETGVETEASTAAPRKTRDLPARLGVEVAIGITLAAVLLLVAWASSSAIRFVYGGY